MMSIRLYGLLLLFIGIVICPLQAKERNYLDPTSPIYLSEKMHEAVSEISCLTLAGEKKITAVSYNIEFSKKLPAIIKQLKKLQADVVFLQEVVGVPDSKKSHAAHDIAQALEMEYVYAPAFIHPKNELDFGVAVLSKYPLSDVSKIILPHVHFQAKTQRIALGVTVLPVCSKPLRLYSVHMETVQWSRWRIDQAQAIVEDSLLYPDMAVVIAGDMNSAPFWQRWHLEKKFSDWGFANLSKDIGRTMCKGPICMKIDLAFARLASLNVITRLKERHSDHFPVFLQFTY